MGPSEPKSFDFVKCANVHQVSLCSFPEIIKSLNNHHSLLGKLVEELLQARDA